MIEDNKFTFKGIAVWLICVSFFVYEFFLRTVIGTFQEPLICDLSLTNLQFSLISSTIFLSIYGLMQIPVGFLIDNFGLKKTLSFGTAICFLSNLAFYFVENYSLAVIIRIFMGLGASFAFISLLVAVDDWLPRKFRAAIIGISQFLGSMGGFLASGPLETAIESGFCKNWHDVFLALGVIGFFIFLLTILFVENNNKITSRYIVLFKPSSPINSIKNILSNYQVIYIGIFTATIYFAVEYLAENEGRIFMHNIKNISNKDASYAISMAWIGYAVGCPFFGIMSDYFARRKIFLIIAAIIGCCAMTSIFYLNNYYIILLSFFALGASASINSVTLAMVAEQVKRQYLALSYGFTNALMLVFLSIFALLISSLVDKSKILHGEINYYYLFIPIISIIITSFLVAIIFIKETYCKSKVEYNYLSLNK